MHSFDLYNEIVHVGMGYKLIKAYNLEFLEYIASPYRARCCCKRSFAHYENLEDEKTSIKSYIGALDILKREAK